MYDIGILMQHGRKLTRKSESGSSCTRHMYFSNKMLEKGEKLEEISKMVLKNYPFTDEFLFFSN